MNPFFFGRSQQPLFGIYHAPKGAARDTAVVICPPIGQEYMRTHRALRQLALHLGKAGLHALRFDYSGTGDSSGENDIASIDGWLADIATAIDELKDTAGVRQVSIAGIRLGASLGFLAARTRRDVDSVVLWDPVVGGGEYLDELLALDASPVIDRADGAVGIGGFALTPVFQREIRAIDLLAVAEHPARRNFLVVSEERADYTRLAEHLAQQPTPSRHAHIPSGGNWADAEQMGAVLLPQAIIQGIVAHLGGGSSP